MTHDHWIGEKRQQVGEDEFEDREPDITCDDPECNYPQVLPRDMDAEVETKCACCEEPIKRPKYNFSNSGWESLCIRCEWMDLSCCNPDTGAT